MKKRSFLIICFLLYFVCIGAAVATRNSYTDIWAEVRAQPQDSVKYVFRKDKDSYFTASPQSLLDQSPLIVLATADSEGENSSKTFLTKMTIQKIYKNQVGLTGDKLIVCEPVRLGKFPAENGKTPLYTMEMSQGNGHLARSKIFPGQEYILFLKKFLPDGYRTELPTYGMVESPYAKLSPNSNMTAKQYQQPVWPIDYKLSSQYEILLQDDKQIDTFFETKQKILSLLK